jgi:hypothetical protein
MNDDYIKRNKRIITISVISLLSILILFYIITNFVLRGRVKIVAPKNSSIYQLDIKTTGYSKKLLGKSSVSFTSNTGEFTYQVEDGQKSAIQTVNIKSGKSYEFEINPFEIKKPNNASKVTATSLNVLANNINYLNPTYNFLERVSIGKNIPSNYPVSPFPGNVSEIFWTNSNQAILKYDNKVGFLNSGKISEISFNQVIQEDGTDAYEFESQNLNNFVANSKNQILASVGPGIVLKQTPDSAGNLLVKDVQGQFVNLALSDNDYYAYSTTEDISDEGESARQTENETDRSIFLKKISDSKFIRKIESTSSITAIVFSPDSEKIAYVNAEGMHLYDISASNNTLLYTKQIAKPNLTTWIDKDKLIYTDQEGVWEMNIENLRADKIIDNANITYLQSFFVDKDEKTLYYSIILPNPAGDNGLIEYIGI